MTEMRPVQQAHPWHGVSPGSQLPLQVVAYIEMTSLDQMKYEIDKLSGHLLLDRPQHWGAAAPYPYGFIPRTLCAERVAALSPMAVADGDPLDIFVLSELPILNAGVLVRARVIGGFPMTDDGDADDKIIAVVAGDDAFGDFTSIEAVPARILQKFEHYLQVYKKDSNITVGRAYGCEHAGRVITAAIEDYRDRFGGE